MRTTPDAESQWFAHDTRKGTTMNKFTKTLVSFAATAALAFGGLAIPVLSSTAQAATPIASQCTGNYTVGSATSNCVKLIQQGMNTLKYTDAYGRALVVDGAFGANTKAAVVKFQKAKGLTQDGIAGKNTIAALDKALGNVAAPPVNTWTYPVKETVNIRSGPGTGYGVVGTAASGSTQTFNCYLTGTSVGGDTVWGHLSNGKGYISDYYIKIGGKTLASVGAPKCNPEPTNSGTSLNASTIQSQFAAYMKAHSNKYGGYYLGDNGCTTMSAWFIGTHSNLTYGNGNGKDVAANLASRNGMSTSTTPVAPAIFSVKAGVATWGASGGVYGHTGVVLSVSGNQATVLWTWTGLTGNANRSQISTYTIPYNSNVTFLNLGSHYHA